MNIRDEIHAQAKRVEQARAAFDWADPLYHDAALLRLRAEEARLSALIAEASGKTVARVVELPWLAKRELVTA
ncbi:MAG: hypothetical protein K6T83_08170 [Alicyclobacillus sp.]|nr:hypothetical protein [Alicyclobacillus sp.]